VVCEPYLDGSADQEADRLYKENFGRMVAFLLRRFHDLDPESAEDIVQDAFSAALTNWKFAGIPANGVGWIYRVCRNMAINHLRKHKSVVPVDELTRGDFEEIRMDESVLEDSQLRLLFACAHPELSPKTQVVITLKYVVNLKTDTIARILGLTSDGADKLLVRARKKIKEERIIFEEPHTEALRPRLAIVHKIIYLIFNEGYKSSEGKEILREQLCEDALLMNKALLDSPLANKETCALQALMLFGCARFEARFSSSGGILDLENQDRTLWNRDLIRVGEDYLSRSRCENISTYHLEAAIACVHCVTDRFRRTDWILIAGLYDRLLQIQPNPFVELSRAIALYYAGQKDEAFRTLYSLLSHAFLHQYHLLNMTLGKFLCLEGEKDQGLAFLEKALLQAPAAKEIEFIRDMMKKFRSR